MLFKLVRSGPSLLSFSPGEFTRNPFSEAFCERLFVSSMSLYVSPFPRPSKQLSTIPSAQLPLSIVLMSKTSASSKSILVFNSPDCFLLFFFFFFFFFVVGGFFFFLGLFWGWKPPQFSLLPKPLPAQSMLFVFHREHLRHLYCPVFPLAYLFSQDDLAMFQSPPN